MRFAAAVGLGSLLLLFGAPAAAHDPFEIATDVRRRESTLELRVTMARSTALRACTEEGSGGSFAPEHFEQVRAALASCAARLYEVVAGAESVPLRSSAVELTLDEDVAWRLTYPGRQG